MDSNLLNNVSSILGGKYATQLAITGTAYSLSTSLPSLRACGLKTGRNLCPDWRTVTKLKIHGVGGSTSVILLIFDTIHYRYP